MKLSKDNITKALKNILESEMFRSSPRSQEFLSYVVRETLEGRAGAMNGTTIAQDVFERGADFDPNIDSIVRVHARRVRSMLRDYYLEHPSRDPVTLTIPKGGYEISAKPNTRFPGGEAADTASDPAATEKKSLKSPLLLAGLLIAAIMGFFGLANLPDSDEDNQPKATTEQAQSSQNQPPQTQSDVNVSDYPLIAVRPFKNETGKKDYDFLEGSLQSILVQDLSRFELVRPVIFDEVYETLPKAGEENQGPYKYAISGKILSVEPELNLYIKLVDLDDGSILSEQEIKRSPDTSGYFNDLSKIVTELSGEFAGLGGVIPKENLSHIEAQISRGTMNLSDLNHFECLVLTDKYQYDPQKTPAKFKAVYTCLREGLQDNPDDPLFLAYLGSLTLWAKKSDPKFHKAESLNPNFESEDGFAMVKRAAEIGPDIGNVQYLYSATLRMNGGSADDVLKHAELARKANPGNPLYMYWLSHSLADAGDWNQALTLAQEARARSLSPPPNYYIPDFARALRYDDKDDMQNIASIIAERGYNYGYLYEFLAAVANDDESGMAKHRAKIDRVDAGQRKRGNDGIMHVLKITIRNPEAVAVARDLFVKAGVIADEQQLSP